MSIFLDKLEKSNENTETKWKGTFREFLELFEKSHHKKNLSFTSHQRIEAMILSYGTSKSDYFGRSRIRYNFFENRLFGAEEMIDSFMAYIHAAARKTETSRRMLLIYGPPSSGKSELFAMIKRGLEEYTKTEEGILFAISGSKMYENPFLLLPDDSRIDFEKEHGIQIEGRLSPQSKWRLDNEYKSKFLDFPVEQIFISEDSRIGIGTFLAGDSKVQDPSELVGSIDLSKIQIHGDESDPRSYAFSGEMNVANRGMMEFVECLKTEEKLLRVLLTATQEKMIKAPRFGLISIDTFIGAHSNEEEYRRFMGEKKYEAYHDRMVVGRAPYNLGAINEVKIYEKLLANSDLNVHIAPHTLMVAAMFSVFSRLEHKESDISLSKKMKLYDGKHVKGYKTEQVVDIKKKSPLEGMYGVSPRFVIDQINTAIAKAQEDGRKFVTALDILRQLSTGINFKDSYKADEKNRYKSYIDLARLEFNDLLKGDIQKAFFLSYEDEARNLCAKYIDQIEASLSDNKPRDPVTGEETELDEKLMESIEAHIEVSHSGKVDFRNEILRFFGNASRKGKSVDYTHHAQLKEAIQKQLFTERQGVIRMTVSSHNPDPEALQRLNAVIDRMVQQQGYIAESANELLKYATAYLFDK